MGSVMTNKVLSSSLTKPETFILESLDRENEDKNTMDGKVLFEILKLNGRNPIYYYFRTQRELIEFAKIFRESEYRYLHLSCHGNDEEVVYTFGSSPYSVFAEIFKKKLNNRRLFISGCSMGNMSFARELFLMNGGMYSITAPTKEVFFNQAVSFWAAFYYMMQAWDSTAMKKARLTQVLTQLTTLFEMPLAHYYRDMSKGRSLEEQLSEEIFDAKTTNLNLSGVIKGVLAGDREVDDIGKRGRQ